MIILLEEGKEVKIIPTNFSLKTKIYRSILMSNEVHFEFRNLDDAYKVREEINKISNGLPASGGYASSSITLDLDELSKSSSETARAVQTIIDRYGGRSW